jgi:hypothetical protein
MGRMLEPKQDKTAEDGGKNNMRNFLICTFYDYYGD